MRTIVFSVLIITLLYNSGAAYPHYQDVRITEFRVKAPIAEEGTALLGCNYNMGDDTLYGLQWSKDGQVFYRYIQLEDKSMIFYLPGVNVDESRSTRNFLTLVHFTRESAGLYRCEVYAHGPRFNVASQEKYVAAAPPRTCTTEDGYSGLCITHNHCSSSSEYGAGVFDARISQTETSCPVPLICCKGEDQVHQQIEPFTYKNDPKTPAEVDNQPQAVACTIRGEQGDEAGECVPRHLCGEGRTIIEDGNGIIGPRTYSTSNCPQSTVCCKIPDNDEPKESANTSRNQNGLSQTAQNETSQARDNYPQTVTCTISEEQGYVLGECVQRHLCGPGRTINEYGEGIIGPRTLSDNCPPATVCCKIPDNDEPKESANPSRDQNGISQTAQNETSQARDNYPQTVTCTISEEQGYVLGECVQRHLCGPGRTINEYGEGIIWPRTLSDNCPPSTVCCKIPDNNEPKNSDSPSDNQNVISPTADNHPETVFDNSASRVNNNRKNPANPHNYQNQLETPTAGIAKPQTLSCKTRDGSSGECVQNYLCDRATNFEITDGEGIIDARMEDDCPIPMVCCKMSDDNEHNNTASRGNNNIDSGSGIADGNDEKDPANPNIYQNQHKTPTEEVTKPQPLSCKTRDGSSGECVQNYLCDIQTNFVLTNSETGEGIIDARMEEDGCPVPMVCCKVPDDSKHNNTASRVNSKHDSGNGAADDDNNKNRANPNNYQNQHKTPTEEVTKSQPLSCKTRDGSSGECVQNYLCDRQTSFAITDGENIIDARMEDGCPVPMVCCKVPDDNEHKNAASQVNSKNDTGNGAADDNNKNRANPNNYQNQHKTPIEEVPKPQPLSCKTRDGSSGECVQNYLCDRQTNFAITDGKDIIDARIEDDGTGCPVPMVCCKVPDKNEHEDFAHPAKDNKEDPTNPSIYQYHTDTLTQEAEQTEKTLETADRLNFDTVPAINYSKEPSIYHLKRQRPRINLNSHSTYNLNLPLSQAPIYPYIRVPRDVSRSGCGWRNPNGVNVTGSVAPLDLEPNQAKPGEFPWTVSVMNFLRREGNSVKFEYLGSGALIHERVVLTAAHVFDRRDTNTNPTPFYVTVGDYDQNGSKYLPRKAIQVENVVIHDNYNLSLNFNDFALVFLLKPVLPSGHVNYICLPPPGHVDPTGVRCVTSGWGKDGHYEYQFVMSTAELPIVEHSTCQNLHRTVAALGPGFILDQTFVCAGGESGVDSCKGSGGAPLACPMENMSDRYILSGLVSWSYNCSLDGRPSVFARVTSVRQWIDDKMAAYSYTISTD